MTTPLFSIIIPVYKAEKYLRRCVDSIIEQTRPDWELILVDDGSPDKSGALCDEYARKDDRIRVTHQKNGGASKARNAGLNEARGAYVSFVDADDWVADDYLDTCASNIEGYDLLFFGSTDCYENGQKLTHAPKDTQAKEGFEIEEAILYLKSADKRFEYFGFTWNKTFRRDIIDRYAIRFQEGLSLREDELFTAEYCKHVHSLRVIPNALYFYRILSTGLTARKNSPEETRLFITLTERNIPTYSYPPLMAYEHNRVMLSWLNAICNHPRRLLKYSVVSKLNRYYKQNVRRKGNEEFRLKYLFGMPGVGSLFMVMVYVLLFKTYRVFRSRKS